LRDWAAAKAAVKAAGDVARAVESAQRSQAAKEVGGVVLAVA